jgi:hypothetical protein
MKKSVLIIAACLSAGLLLSPLQAEAQGKRGNKGEMKGKAAEWKAKRAQKKPEMQQKWKDKTIQNKENAAAKREAARQKWLEKRQQRKQLSPEERQKMMEEKKAKWKARWGEKNAEKISQMREKWQQMRQENPQYQGLQEKIKALREAKGSGVQGAWQERMQQLRQHYQGMDPQNRSNLHQQMPEFAQKLDKMQQNPKMWETSFETTGPGGGKHSYQGTTEKKGNAWSKEGTWTNPAGKTISVEGTGVRTGNDVNKEVKVTGPNGNSQHATGQTTHDQGKATTEWKTDNGASLETSSEWMFDILED